VATILALCAAMCAAQAPAGVLSATVAARALTPGELLVLTIAVDGEPERLQVTLFEKDVPVYRLAAGQWQALAGIDLDRPPGRYTMTVAATAQGATIIQTQDIVVAGKEFATRRLRVDPGFVNPPPAQLARIAADRAFLDGVFAASADTRLWSSPFVRPVPGAATSRFGSRSVFNGAPRSPHGGADLLSPAGTPVKAPNAGRIVCARDLFFTGQTVVVDHGLGVFSLLAHLSRRDVQEGEIVTAGRILGLVGATGRVTGPHLHWGVTVAGARVDPMSVLTLLGQPD
jgi:murein DD-endopeptidase MepM/ murein hydrolase activator NlpD